MNGADLLRAVDTVHREKDIPREAIFAGIEKAIRLAIHKKFDDDEEDHPVEVVIDRTTGTLRAQRGEELIPPEALGRIAAAAAKQFLIQSFKEVESETVFNIYANQKGDMVHGTVTRYENGNVTVSLGKAEAFVPRRE